MDRMVTELYREVSGKDNALVIQQRARHGYSLAVVPRNISVVVVKEPEGGFSAYSPDVKGARTQGETEEELERNMVEAVELVLEARGEQHPFNLILSASK